MERARAFYEAVFETKLEHLPSPPGPEGQPGDEIVMWTFPMSEQGYGAGGALVRMDGVEPGGGGTLVYFHCEDCAAEAARAAEHGGDLVQGKMPIGQYGFIALVHDTEGNLIGLHSMQ